MLPRVAFEYGHTWCAAATILTACVRVGDLRQRHIELHGELEAAIFGGEQADPAVDRHVAAPRRVRDVRPHRARPRSTPRNPTAKSCSGFVPPPSPPISFGRRSCRSSWPSACASVTVRASAGDRRLGRIENPCHRNAPFPGGVTVLPTKSGPVVVALTDQPEADAAGRIRRTSARARRRNPV